MGLFASITLVVGLLAACGDGKAGTKDGDVIKIGVNLELSGAVASYGTSEADGIDLAVDEINDAGGIDGKQIKKINLTDQSKV